MAAAAASKAAKVKAKPVTKGKGKHRTTAAAKQKKAKPKVVCQTVTKKVHGKRRRVRVCTPVKKTSPARKATKKVVLTGTRPVVGRVVAAATPPAPVDGPVPYFTTTLTQAHMERLLWRAGFGPLPGQAAQLAGQDPRAAIFALTRPSGAATLVGPAPTIESGAPLQPADVWGHNHLWWLDRMVRSDQPLVERMTLIWHDWFATSIDGGPTAQQLLDQNATLRAHALDGTFDDLFAAMTVDPAMLVWLNGNANVKTAPNENYAREMMELFSLGADRGAYTEADVREMARALTGWRNDYLPAQGGNVNFRFDPARHDTTNKTIFGQTGNFDYHDATRLCVTHPLHASFFVTKLWSYFIPTPPDDDTLAALQGVYLNNGRQIRPVVEAILKHPLFFDGPAMTVGPVVFNAGLLRAVGRGIDTSAWSWLSSYTGQTLFRPPNVAGWDATRWLDTSTVRGRWTTAHYALSTKAVNPWPAAGAPPTYSATESAGDAVTAAMAFLGNPPVSAETQAVVAQFASTCVATDLRGGNRNAYRAMRQNALRMLLATCPDRQVC